MWRHGGRGVVVGPILSQARSDVFCHNENGPNFLFQNNGDDGDGRMDIVYGNWNGPHRLFMQGPHHGFRNIATTAFASPSPVRSLIAADFDNDKNLEVFFNNMAYRGLAPNSLFR
ncbi:hypothetical protein CRUP_019410 [Coryphaenoides rupestris]|nr:hypothetical protein CRUP_019410 [Coryphaenoides rupestris]